MILLTIFLMESRHIPTRLRIAWFLCLSSVTFVHPA